MNVPLKKLAIATGLAAAMLAGMSLSPARAGTDTAPGQNMSRQIAALATENRHPLRIRENTHGGTGPLPCFEQSTARVAHRAARATSRKGKRGNQDKNMGRSNHRGSSRGALGGNANCGRTVAGQSRPRKPPRPFPRHRRGWTFWAGNATFPP